MSRMRHSILAIALLGAVGCVVKGAEPPVTAGDGVSVNNGVVTLDEGKVPVLPTNCAEGQLVAKTKTGWECVTPAQPELLKAGDGINVESNTISARFGTGHTDIATGDHNHDGVYRKESEKVAWSDVDAMPTDVWPGSVPYSQLTGAPALDWNMVGPTVKQDTPWPGQVDYSHLTNVPAPYTDMQAQAAVTWNTVKGSVKSTDAWPGTMPYSALTGAPAPYTDAQAQAAVKWSNINGSVQSTDTWPGQVSYSQVTGAPAVSWNTVSSSVSSGTQWPGTVDYSHIANAPTANWNTVSQTVSSTTQWPGQVDYSRVTNAPTTPTQYTDAQAQAAVTWSSVKGSVHATDPWPGAPMYTDAQAAAAAKNAVTWNTVAPSVSATTAWPGTMPYSALTNAPADLTTVAAQAAAAQTKLHVAAATDLSFVNLTGNGMAAQTVVSTFTFSNIPAGAALIMVDVPFAVSSGGNSGGGLVLQANGTDIAQMPTNTSFVNTVSYPLWDFRAMSGVLSNFPGGSLTITLYAWGDNNQTKLEFGTTSADGRFGRHVTVLGGL